MCIESFPRRPQVVTFDDALLALELVPGLNGKGAVLDAWADPIGAHDRKVLELEEAMIVERDLVRHNTAQNAVPTPRLRVDERGVSLTHRQILLLQGKHDFRPSPCPL